MKVFAKPKQAYRFLGTGIRLSQHLVYPVVAATNQPDWEEKRLVFILEDLFEPSRSMGCLLTSHDVDFENGATFEDLLA